MARCNRKKVGSNREKNAMHFCLRNRTTQKRIELPLHHPLVQTRLLAPALRDFSTRYKDIKRKQTESLVTKEPLTLLKYFKGLGHKSSLMTSATYVMGVIREHPHLEHAIFFRSQPQR